MAIFVLLLVGGWSFAHNHPTQVTIDYWFGEWIELPLWLVLLCAFGSGVALTGLLAAVEMARMSLVARRYRSALAGLEEEVHQLRNLPLAAEEAAGESDPTDRSDEALDAGGSGAHP
ncbi:MAG: LapA family protein [Myxococcota bacterium]